MEKGEGVERSFLWGKKRGWGGVVCRERQGTGEGKRVGKREGVREKQCVGKGKEWRRVKELRG